MADDPTAAAAVACPCCAKPGIKLCSECRDIAYCSVECQRRDWKIHKHLCKTLKDFLHRPAPDMRRVVYFPPDGNRPTFRWLEIVHRSSHQAMRTDGTDLEKCYGLMECSINLMAERLLLQPILIMFDDSFEFKYPSANTALMIATNGQLGRMWKGPIFAYTGSDCEDGIAEVHDFSLSQYSAMINFFVAFSPATQGRIEGIISDLAGLNVGVVRLSPAGKGNAEMMQGLEIPSQDIFRMVMTGRTPDIGAVPRNTSHISLRIGLQLCAYKLTTEQSSRTSALRSIAPMFINIGPDTFGTVSPDWIDVDSYVMLFRYDGEGLDLDFAVMFCTYCRFHVGPFIEWALEASTATRLPRIKRVQEEVTPNKWTSYQSQYQKMLNRSDEVTEITVGGAPRMGLAATDADTVVARILGVEFPDTTPMDLD